VGWALGVVLAGGAAVAVAAGLAAVYALDSFDTLGVAMIFATLPFAVGVLAAPGLRPVSRRVRRTLSALAAVAAVVAAVAAAVWGPEAWTWIDRTRQEARGARFAAARDYARADEAFSRAIADAPNRSEPLAMRAQARIAAKRLDEALADLDAALRLAPGSATLYAQRADVQRQRNRPAAALADLDAALRLAPDDANWLALRAQARLETGDPKGAHDDLAQASRLAPGSPEVRDVSAAWDIDAGDFDAALRDLNARLHDDPGDVDAIFRRGRAWFYKGEFARAETDFAEAAAGTQELYPALWRFLAQTRRPAPAEADLRARLASAPSEWPAPVARMLLGEIDLAAARAQAADAGERCEADFYFAASRLGRDASEVSADRLRAALGECPPAFIEYEGAKAALRRLAL
jgi:tetratricopeptide (TPR) repeat protein